MGTGLSTELTGSLAELNEGLADDASGYDERLVIVKINHPDSKFVLGGMPPQNRLEGVILASKKSRILYPKYGNENTGKEILELTNKRPFCSSSDSISGVLVEDIEWDKLKQDDPAIMLKNQIAEGALVCKPCPLNQWESVQLLGKDGKGKACGEIRRLLFWRAGVTVPILLTITSTSIRNWDAYCSALEATNSKHNLVITEIGLEPVKGLGQNYSRATFQAVGAMTNVMADELMVEVMTPDGMKKRWQHLRDIFIGRELSLDETPDANGDNSGVPQEEDDL